LSVVYFSERVSSIFWILHTLAWALHTLGAFLSGNTLTGEMPGRITLESFDQPHGYEEGGHVCFTPRFAFYLMSFTMGYSFLRSDYDGGWPANTLSTLGRVPSGFGV
jgi:hypothetical protein